MFLHKVFEQNIDRDLMNLLFCTLGGRVLYTLSLASRKGSLSMIFFRRNSGQFPLFWKNRGWKQRPLVARAFDFVCGARCALDGGPGSPVNTVRNHSEFIW